MILFFRLGNTGKPAYDKSSLNSDDTDADMSSENPQTNGSGYQNEDVQRQRMSYDANSLGWKNAKDVPERSEDI